MYTTLRLDIVYVTTQSFADVLSGFRGSVPEGFALVESFRESAVTPELFFQSLPIEMDFFFCAFLEDLNDCFIESTEDFPFFIESQNENDAFGEFGTTSVNVTVPIMDNDGAYELMYAVA